MRTEQALWTSKEGWRNGATPAVGAQAQLAFAFGARAALAEPARFRELRQRYPQALIATCSTGGEIHGQSITDDAISVTAVQFDRVALSSGAVPLEESGGSFAAGVALAKKLALDELRLIFVLSDGTRANGSALIRGIRSVVGDKVTVTGGLAGDGSRFEKTLVGLDGAPQPRQVIGIGFGGAALRVGHGSEGGWDVFGPERRISRAEGNVLFELDGKPALELYKRYLGEEAAALPGSALLFPLRIYQPSHQQDALVRTIVGIDEARQAMIFAGDMPQGHCGQLMRGNFDRLIGGAADAARQALSVDGDSLAILVSCIGRKLLLGQRTVEEVEAVAQVLGERAALTGFYSYGEISPHERSGFCELHNQTMTVTVIGEA